MNEQLFIKKVLEVADQVRMRLARIEHEVEQLQGWIETLEFFVEKRKEGVKGET